MIELAASVAPASRNARWSLLLPMLGYGLFVGKGLVVEMNPTWAVLLLVWAAAATGLAWWLTRPEAQSALDHLDRQASRIAVGAIVVAAMGSVTVSILQFHYFAVGAHAEDTAYYSQVLWNTLHGNFLTGNLQQERLYDPPVSNDLALHVSAVLLGLLPVYGIFPHSLTLLILRDLALAAAAWPLFQLARQQMGGTAGVAAVLLYLTNPAVLAQSVEAFYPSQFAPLPFFWALLAFARQAFGSFAAWTAAAISTREDVTITVAGFGLLALVRGRSLKWLAIGLGMPVVWWALVTLIIQPAFGRWGNNVVEITFAGGHHAQFGMYQVLLDPGPMLQHLRQDGLAYLYQMLRPVAFLPMLGSEWLVAAPGLAANLLFARMFYPTGDPFSRFALLPACALVGAAVLVASRSLHGSQRDMRGLSLVVLLLLPSVTLVDGAKDAVQARLRAHTVWNDAAALEDGLARIPAAASVAAPNYALPALAARPRLFYLQYLHMYAGARPDYLLLDRNLDRVTQNPALRERYVALLDRLSRSTEYEPVWQEGEYVLLRRSETPA